MDDRRKRLMNIKEELPAVGVLVGRFQVPTLHEAHRNLIKTVCSRHNKVVVILGQSPLWSTQNNPLDFQARRQMIQDEFPEVEILYIQDVHDDSLWSKNLDKLVVTVAGPAQGAILYGSRDSFIPHYNGKYPTTELDSEIFVSGTQARKDIARSKTRNSEDFRAGAIWSTFQRFPTCFPTVDAIIVDEDETRLLLGRKENEKRYRFIGGFADPTSSSYEADVRREVAEETGISVTDVKYLSSFIVDDWRYRGEVDKIKTLVFICKHSHGKPKPADDIAEVRWIALDELNENFVVPEHAEIVRLVNNHYQIND